MSKDRAFELLLSQNYSSLIVTIECIGVSIYHADNKQLLDEVEHDIMNYQNRGLCYLKPKAEADNTDTRF